MTGVQSPKRMPIRDDNLLEDNLAGELPTESRNAHCWGSIWMFDSDDLSEWKFDKNDEWSFGSPLAQAQMPSLAISNFSTARQRRFRLKLAAKRLMRICGPAAVRLRLDRGETTVNASILPCSCCKPQDFNMRYALNFMTILRCKYIKSVEESFQ